MNTNPDAKRILCFGDSNTNGQKPYNTNLGYWERHPVNVRWTGVLQNMLGNKYEILEEGLGGRALDKQNPNLDIPTNGLDAWSIALLGHKHIDACIWMLGVNDTQDCFDFSINQVEQALQEHETRFKSLYPNSTLVILNFPVLRSGDFHSAQSIARSKEIRREIEKLFSGREVDRIFYIDLDGEVRYSSQDELHFDAQNHKILGEMLAERVKEVIG